MYRHPLNYGKIVSAHLKNDRNGCRDCRAGVQLRSRRRPTRSFWRPAPFPPLRPPFRFKSLRRCPGTLLLCVPSANWAARMSRAARDGRRKGVGPRGANDKVDGACRRRRPRGKTKDLQSDAMDRVSRCLIETFGIRSTVCGTVATISARRRNLVMPRLRTPIGPQLHA